ncbi:endonuclease/exonuclease/phosphatase family protein [Herbidospora cretacea]|uniref:endonuclease/exonuclease/phosphatase family protein n=1 Tax=Herbidospora cretacea TaxID=28444 RepID=UPI0012DED93D|nr:endonuclease/exonuclease/phosphatase family protein [Herbidospora cretacea]
MDAVRVLFPSLITIYGQAGDTPPEQLGLFAALWFVLPLAALLLPPRWAVLGGAAVLAAGRLALQATDGGLPQLYVSAVSVTAAIVFLYGSAKLVAGPHARLALPLGLALSQSLHLAIGHVDLAWRDGPLPWIPTLLITAAFAWAVAGVTTADEPAPGRLWFAFGPALLLTGMYLGPSALIGDGVTAGERLWPTLALLGTLALLVVAALVGRPAQLAGVPLLIGLWIAHLDGRLTMAALPLFVVGLGACLRSAGEGAGRHSGGALLGGMLVFFAGTFVYYAAYDLNLGFDNSFVVLALGLTIAGTAVRPRDVPDVRLIVVIAAAVALAVAVPRPAFRLDPAGQPVDRNEFTLIAYNIRMGFGLSGTLDVDEIADWAKSREPDVVLLSEVDRGWFLNGGHDTLDRIATRMGMRYYFAPAADELWGDALLTNLPVRQVRSYPLIKDDYPTGAQAQVVTVEIREMGVGIVNTHLQSPEIQSAMMRGVMPRPPSLLAGDLNLTPDDPALVTMMKTIGLTDPLKDFGDPPTSPAGAPIKRIDHVLLREGVKALSVEVAKVPFSDHLPIVARLRVG